MKKFLFFIPLLASIVFAKNIECQVEVQPASFGINDQAYLIISANQDISQATLEVPNTNDFRLHYESQSSQASWINGSMTYTSTLYFRIIPSKPGTFTIPAFQGRCKGEAFTIPATQFSVTDQGNYQGQQSQATSSIALVVQGDLPQKLYVGQCYPIQIQLLTAPNVRGQLLSFPQKQGDAFSVSHLIDAPQKTTVNVQGKTLSCLYWPALVTTLQSGTFPLSFSIDMEIEQQMKTRRLLDDDPLDILSQGFGGMFGRNEPISVKTKQKNIQVLPLPLPQPTNFNHAIGTFQLSTPQTKEKEFIQNEPLTLCVKVGGQGNFENIQAPTLQYDASLWRMYEPKSSFEAKDFLGYEGNLNFEYTLVPLKDGVQELPKACFCFFNPKTGEYESIARSALSSITVKPAIHTTATSKIISINEINEEKTSDTTEFIPTIFIDKICWESPHSFDDCIYILLLSTLLFCCTAYRKYRQENDKNYQQKKAFKNAFKNAYNAVENAFKQKDGRLFYGTFHSLLELLFKEKNTSLNTMLSQNSYLSDNEKSLLQNIEQTYHETNFGGKQYPCPENITPFKKLIQALK